MGSRHLEKDGMMPSSSGMETQTRVRPELPPLLVGHGNRELSCPRTIPDSATGPIFSASLAPPSPLYPASPGYDQTMRAHERALVDRLGRPDHGERRGSQQSPVTARPPSPMSEQHISNAQCPAATISSLPRSSLPLRRPPGFLQGRVTQTIASQTREILLKGVSSQPSQQTLTSAGLADSRHKSPGPMLANGRRTIQPTREALRAWDHLYLDNGAIADCFVAAFALRRHSANFLTDQATSMTEEPSGGGKKVTIRALVKPCDRNRKPYLLRREFDMDNLRATIPEPPPLPAGSRRSPVEHISQQPSPAIRRRSSTGGSARSTMDLSQPTVRNSYAMPIHRKYALAFFPVLAAILYSGLVAKGDIIEVPLPHPEVWARTVAYAYTGQEELTEAIKQNIMYLGGKV
ncbi:hypothetical protein VTH82DRAFT_3880 [Thermothelomyces myriococcoides]